MEITIEGRGASLEFTEVTLAKKGSKEAFASIIRKNEKTMYRVAKNYLSRNEDILDAMSAATLKAFEKINTLNKEGYFKTWLIRILINECLMIIRKSNNEVLENDELVLNKGYKDSYENIDLKRALELLPKSIRIILTLYYYEDFSVKDIAGALDMNENTVKTKLKRGREKLYSILGEDYHE
ncbi:sigma-70 family RNA polymerase sigma factor [Clostridium frigidicarnis]|uniref:RNA polymerase sigma-70 factor, ECF subfamily n=1 Tax=Clostridium frigidicarnis TaxID=84698 RepID=A0A1I0XC64_9CLOT|nr:sigma-70 family RNA polymerase sigma factor [Clostridium frigidicarnis]SFA98571.1 RNA polymerase sigma-70 factor, ECF subfamily [Clostridium frigidicarnis]